MLRLTFVVIISIPYIIMLYAKTAYYDKHPDRFSEEDNSCVIYGKRSNENIT